MSQVLDAPSEENTESQQERLWKHNVLGHPAGLFFLFFTEMWERFSYYGMRALLVLFLISGIAEGGWAWTREDANLLYALYTGLVYITPILGGMLADQLLGHRNTVLVGALLMTCGHASMALETEFTFYTGLVLLILGNGAFKPNISSIVGGLYTPNSKKKDPAYTIFYMGINAGAFLGILLCGYVGERVGWSYGFGLAGIFMFFGMIMFYFARGIFGDVGARPLSKPDRAQSSEPVAGNTGRMITWAGIGLALVVLISGLLLYYEYPKSTSYVLGPLVGLMVAVIGYTVTDPQLRGVEKDRVWVVVILSLFTIFFWMAFEQAGSSMTIFAADYTDRTLEGTQAMAFKIINTILTIAPLAIVTWVLFLLAKETAKSYPMSVLFISLSFVVIWIISLWMLYRDFRNEAAEVPASWYGILNSFFIIALAPLFSKMWEKWNPAGPIKFALGLILLGLGFGVLAYGGLSIEQGAKTASVSMIWLILAYWFHTIGELCLSPVGLSYVSKLAPARLVGMMFGVWFGATALANYLAGFTASYIDKISEEYSMTVFFLIYTVVPIAAGLILIVLNGFLKKKMHGIH
ncbi:MAG: peptide MFS transporter [Bacteroidota bacterium]